MRVALNVNGVRHEVDVEPRDLLSDVLRDKLRLTGTHRGCDTAQCGACTVHVDGCAVKSCNVLALQLDGCDVTTIEGMTRSDGVLHPVQSGFQNCHGLQCGFCTPGMVMAVDALLRECPAPSDAQIREGLEGNLCRCTGYENIVRAVKCAVSTQA